MKESPLETAKSAFLLAMEHVYNESCYDAIVDGDAQSHMGMIANAENFADISDAVENWMAQLIEQNGFVS